MSFAPLTLTPALHEYLLQVSVVESPVARELRAKTVAMAEGRMLAATEQVHFLAWLVGLTGAKRGIEVGTFTGYTALHLAQALPADGKLVCCDISKEWTDLGREAWAAQGVAHKIDLHLAPAGETLANLRVIDGDASFDFAYIDADKENYDSYYELTLSLLKVGGFIAIDNVLWSGAVIDASNQTEATNAVRAINNKIANGSRVTRSLLPIGDGLMLLRKL